MTYQRWHKTAVGSFTIDAMETVNTVTGVVTTEAPGTWSKDIDAHLDAGEVEEVSAELAAAAQRIREILAAQR
jgi:hypothetical protein